MLSSIPLFSCLTPEEMEQIILCSKRQNVEKGTTLFHEGDPGTGIYVILKGKVKIFKLSLEGKEKIFHIYGAGHTFGEVPVFAGKHFPASAMTLEPSTLLFIPRDKLTELIRTTPCLAMNMLADLSQRLRFFTVQIENLSLKEIPARLAAYILTLIRETAQDNTPTPQQVSLPISKAQLANLIGTTPETVSRILKKMMDAGLIDVQARTIIILHVEGLHELSETGRI